MIKLSIDNTEIEVEDNKTVLEAALQSGIYIPSLCYHPDLDNIGACRLCIVEIENIRGYPASCTTKATEGMVVHTNTEKIQELRKSLVWFILSEHPKAVDKSSQLMKVIEWVGIKEFLPGFTPTPKDFPPSIEEALFDKDLDRCILCDRCVRVCHEVRGVGAIGLVNRGINTFIGTSFNSTFQDAACKFCGACVEVCPTGALTDKVKFEEVDREKTLVPCKYTCPAQIDIPRYVRLITEGKYQDSLEVIREKVPFPNVLGHVCFHPCEEECRRDELNGPISIRVLKRFVAEKDSGRWRSKIEIAKETGKKVAIVGSGPAGLTTAWYLRILGHTITVFEAMSETGGMMRAGIPEYRLPRTVLDGEIDEIKNIGVEIKTNSEIESVDELFNQGFDAVFLAMGAPEGMNAGVPGDDDPRVLDGISVLKAINFGEEADVTGDVAVIGGGNVAMDVARCVQRVVGKKVTILYRRTRQEMPASAEEIEEALEEGVEIDFLVAPQKVTPKGDKLNVECIRMELGEPDDSGRRRPVPIKGSEFTISVDRLIAAIGQRSNVPEKFDIEVNKRGRIEADEQTLSCSKEGVFSGGDVVTGPASVIEAISDGRKAAVSIDKYLGGKGEIEQAFVPAEEENPWIGREAGFAYNKRVETTLLSPDKRETGFSQVECSLDEKKSVEEAERCLKCQIRLTISPTN